MVRLDYFIRQGYIYRKREATLYRGLPQSNIELKSYTTNSAH